MNHLFHVPIAEQINLGTEHGATVLEVIKACEEATERPIEYDVEEKREGTQLFWLLIMARPGIVFPGPQKHRYLIVLVMLGDGTQAPPIIDYRFSAKLSTASVPNAESSFLYFSKADGINELSLKTVIGTSCIDFNIDTFWI